MKTMMSILLLITFSLVGCSNIDSTDADSVHAQPSAASQNQAKLEKATTF